MRKTDNYILFIDESGKSKLSDVGDHFLLTGIIIDKDLNSALSHYMLSLKEKSGISADENIHAFDLFESEKVKNIHHKHRHIKVFFDRLCALVQGADIRCIIVRISKLEYQKMITKRAQLLGVTEKSINNRLKKSELHDFLYEALARRLILQFGNFLQKNDACGEVVAESRRQDDGAMLRAFIDSTQLSKFKENTHYHSWSVFSFKKIYSMVFQNKKGLSFGLEIADLFAWAHFNNHYGKKRTFPSKAKNQRVDIRLRKVEDIMKESLLKNDVEDITRIKLNKIAGDRVSKFTELLKEIKPLSNFGDPTV